MAERARSAHAAPDRGSPCATASALSHSAKSHVTRAHFPAHHRQTDSQTQQWCILVDTVKSGLFAAACRMLLFCLCAAYLSCKTAFPLHFPCIILSISLYQCTRSRSSCHHPPPLHQQHHVQEQEPPLHQQHHVQEQEPPLSSAVMHAAFSCNSPSSLTTTATPRRHKHSSR